MERGYQGAAWGESAGWENRACHSFHSRLRLKRVDTRVPRRSNPRPNPNPGPRPGPSPRPCCPGACSELRPVRRGGCAAVPGRYPRRRPAKRDQKSRRHHEMAMVRVNRTVCRVGMWACEQGGGGKWVPRTRTRRRGARRGRPTARRRRSSSPRSRKASAAAAGNDRRKFKKAQ